MTLRKTTMRTFVLERGTTQRFWNILFVGTRALVTCTGTSGPGDVTTHRSDDSRQLESHRDRLIEEKLAEGYTETTDLPWHGGYASDLRSSMEDTLDENPDDLATHMAYADHLMELGDPRGEFIQVQLALEDESVSATERKKLKRREKALLAKHERTWLGPMAGHWIDKVDAEANLGYRVSNEPHELEWRRGWIHKLWLNDGIEEAGLAAVARAPLLRYLRDFRILRPSDNRTMGPYRMLTANIFKHVRVLQFGHPDTEENYFYENYGVDEFLEQMPNLEELHLFDGNDADFVFGLKLPQTLKQLSIHHGPELYSLEQLANKESLSELELLSCWPRGFANDHPNERPDNRDGGKAPIARSSAVALFRSKNFPKLRHLRLRNSDIGDEGIRELIASGCLKKLKTLDLLGGCVTEVGARLLAESPDLQSLESLNLSENMIGEQGLGALRATGVNLTDYHQLGPETLHSGFYEYLHSGDCE